MFRRISAGIALAFLVTAVAVPVVAAIAGADPACATGCDDDCIPGCERCTCAHRPLPVMVVRADAVDTAPQVTSLDTATHSLPPSPTLPTPYRPPRT
jgi:hypothetical protein